MQKNNIFYSKLLLFGEYSILLGSSALSIPYSHFRAEFSFIKEDKYTDLNQAIISNQSLKEFSSFLHNGWQKAQEYIKTEELDNEINDGLYFESNIPQGYGLGSSGSLCAAVYERFAINPIPINSKISHSEINQLREILSGMESFFHGKSSGIDPLAIYLRSPLLINHEGEAKMVGIPRQWNSNTLGIFLLNTNKSGKTNSLVPSFMEKFAPNGNISAKGIELCTLNNKCINHLFNVELELFWENLKNLSIFQLKNFKYIIPDAMIPIWEKGLESGLFHLKICGSGGGGFLIGFAKNYELANNYLKKEGLQIVPVYLSAL